jgi:endonuclease/exonuclease/phosphatase family metal-dependent hydrolase
MVTGGSPRRRVRPFFLAFAAVLMLMASGATAAHAVQETPRDLLQVWNLNTHGMDKGPGTPEPEGRQPGEPRTNYLLFVDYITSASRTYYPDIVTLQEAGTQTPVHLASCQQFVRDLEVRTGNRDYNCYESGKQGGAAIVYRTARLTPVTIPPPVRLDTFVDDPNNSDPNVGTCDPGSWYAFTLRLQDRKDSTKFVNVASVHLPNTPQARDCAWENMKIINPKVTTDLGAAKMHIMAGDWNHRDATAGPNDDQFQAWECWYRGVNVFDPANPANNNPPLTCGGQNFAWKDAMYKACQNAVPGSAEATKFQCLHLYSWTYNATQPAPYRRIDFLFTKAYEITDQVTVSTWPNPTQYSDHRGQGALLKHQCGQAVCP